ncbi:hypothetical protein FRZ06_02905 [Anoxybacterium hadale]|uniref:Uncharacterized protein n=1 Tax=Anoxybacterium hadale TaxID=3408580 RepID=A0ACD1A7I1_9FIRM|nr:hypothetical protein FRZ06_02905 [Clostridiales bacterium]
MFIKYGEELHLLKLMTEGLIYFNPCEYFRNLEIKQMERGIGDCNDGGILASGEVTLQTSDGKVYKNKNQSVAFIAEPCLKTPVFCIKRAKSDNITVEERHNLAEQFPKHTHALIIENEVNFLENIRYCFRSKAFCHDIFYQNELFTDFTEYLFNAISETYFYEPKKKARYYATFTSFLNSGEVKRLRIDDSNYFKTMFRKNLFFKEQSEFRIVLPYKKQEAGELYQIKPVSARLCRIDELVH